ncbi:hypothetical protein LTR37_000383 [Vermiconidia calcicola]|uniref:Uncharacterized protein n=1 Tax=Vermiconidia calcicola TaxID=1690605 RepID=A0ACC3NYR2_9PEZI|nr:hypothetical protein LTR37_000383 [Vermiconidia calcicola]
MATVNGTRALPRALRRTRWQGLETFKRRATTAAAVEYNEPEPFIPEVPLQPPPLRTERKQAVREAKPFSDFLTDTFDRQHDYLRISVTERCNLRCLYCMPEEGIQLSPNKELLTSAEIYYLSALFVNQGVNKIRLTGGEPTIRKDIVPLMQQIGSLRRNGLKELALTTNAISLHRKLDAMVEAGLTGVNISLDTLDPFEFQLLTRRQGFDAVMKSINRIQEMNKQGAGLKLKINAVVMRGLNDHQIMPFVEKTRDEDIEVRFIEYMPFGGNKWSQKKMLPYSEMLDLIRQKYPDFAQLKGAKNDTSKTWQVPGFKGRIGFITSMTHNFCGTCNRLRITSDGNLKVCLHGNTEVSLRDLLRKDQGGEPLDGQAFEAIRQIELDRRKGSGLRHDGEEGWMSKEQQLLEVIGAAVKRKKEKHAGMGELENMTNRPMILIGGSSDARNSSVDPPRPLAHEDTEGERPSEQSTGLGSMFGFQSLSGLFQQPEPRRRYSRPPEPNGDKSSMESFSGSDIAGKPVEGEGAKVDVSFFRRSRANGESRSSTESKENTLPSKVENHEDEGVARIADGKATTGRQRSNENTLPSKAESHEGENVARIADGKATTRRGRVSSARGDPGSQQPYRPIVRRHVINTPGKYQRSSGAPNGAPNPFVKQRSQAPSQLPTSSTNPETPWGLNQTDMATVDSIVDPGQYIDADTHAPSTSVRDHAALGNSSANNAQTTEKLERQTAAAQQRVLTHVTSSGKAQMVDVGTKTNTKRVAIAIARVDFSNHEPFKLIFENNNKKGDVLGVARVAAIMASKRTSDLIPLCHPIAINKVDVDVRLHPPGTQLGFSRHAPSKFGCISIEAQVECTGPTGVEMEALTAVTSGAMTVYDMCKAVDRDMVIRSAQVVYKSGGKSGLHADPKWAGVMGKEFFTERNLELPRLNGDAAVHRKPQQLEGNVK